VPTSYAIVAITLVNRDLDRNNNVIISTAGVPPRFGPQAALQSWTCYLSPRSSVSHFTSSARRNRIKTAREQPNAPDSRNCR
jgi:hypothetical protein